MRSPQLIEARGKGMLLRRLLKDRLSLLSQKDGTVSQVMGASIVLAAKRFGGTDDARLAVIKEMHYMRT